MTTIRYLLLPFVFFVTLFLLVPASQAGKIKKKTVEKKEVREDWEYTFCKLVNPVAMFPGGSDSLLQFLSNHIIYPDSAVNSEIEGTIKCQFVISGKGKVTGAAIIKGLGYGIDEEVLRVFNSMPDWIPAEQGGLKVAYRLVQSITFIIPAEDTISQPKCDYNAGPFL